MKRAGRFRPARSAFRIDTICRWSALASSHTARPTGIGFWPLFLAHQRGVVALDRASSWRFSRSHQACARCAARPMNPRHAADEWLLAPRPTGRDLSTCHTPQRTRLTVQLECIARLLRFIKTAGCRNLLPARFARFQAIRTAHLTYAPCPAAKQRVNSLSARFRRLSGTWLSCTPVILECQCPINAWV